MSKSSPGTALQTEPFTAHATDRRLGLEDAKADVTMRGIENDAGRNRRLVLVVEDDHLNMLGVVQLLNDADQHAVIAFNADEALHVLGERDDIALLLTDCAMPGSLDGPRLAHIVRERWPHIEIIVYSGSTPQDRSSLPLGVRFFHKPIDPAKLALTLKEMRLDGTVPRAIANRRRLPPSGIRLVRREDHSRRGERR